MQSQLRNVYAISIKLWVQIQVFYFPRRIYQCSFPEKWSSLHNLDDNDRTFGNRYFNLSVQRGNLNKYRHCINERNHQRNISTMCRHCMNKSGNHNCDRNISLMYCPQNNRWNHQNYEVNIEKRYYHPNIKSISKIRTKND